MSKYEDFYRQSVDQPEAFWAEQKARPDFQSRVTQALTSLPRIVPVSYPMTRRSR